jgi:hypothetical protein
MKNYYFGKDAVVFDRKHAPVKSGYLLCMDWFRRGARREPQQ